MKHITRRQFLKGTAALGVGLALPTIPFKRMVRSAYAFNQSPAIPLFGTSLRGVGPGGIPVALPGPEKAKHTLVTHYDIGIREFQDQITPNLGKTTLWGYVPKIGLGGNVTPTHLGGIIVAQKGVPIQLTFANNLPNRHILPVDTTIPGANQAPNRTAVHFHGGLVPWISDGGPFDWWAPNGTHGLSFLNNDVLSPGNKRNEAEYYYPLNQTARFGWYHDHAVGITRLNAYAGIASGLIIRDEFELNLVNRGLPNYIEAGGNEIPLIFQDKVFAGDLSADPGYQGLRTPGSLWYAHTYDQSRWDQLTGSGISLPPDPSSIPEFFGDTMLVNGTTFPEVTVQARRYRLRMLNACNARFLNLQLYVADGSPEGITLDNNGIPTNQPFLNHAVGDQPFWLQIATEGGFLVHPAKVPSNQPFGFKNGYLPDGNTGQTDPSQVLASLLVSPAERPDLIVDFTGYANHSIVLYNDAPAPFPSGDDRNDYFPGYNFGSGANGQGNPANTSHPGVGPNSRVLMRFNVVAASGQADRPLSFNGVHWTRGIDPALLPWGFTDATHLPFRHRFLSLNEYHDEYGRLIQILGNAAAPYGSPYFGSATYPDYPGGSKSVGSTHEHVHDGETEVWEIFNTTGDVHPMHFHLVNVQVINRQLFDVANLNFHGLTGPVIPPADNEIGWKETVPMYPGTVTRVIMKFDVPQILAANGRVIKTPPSPRTGGNEYVWHCHILEHEEHDMMHALVVT